MSDAARRAGRQIARTIAGHTRETAHRAVERRSNDIGQVVKSNGKGRVEVLLPGVGVSLTESDLYFILDPSELEIGDQVLVVAIDNEYAVVGVLS